MAYGIYEELQRLDGTGLYKLNDMLRYLHDTVQTHMTADSTGLALHPPALQVTVNNDASRVLDIAADSQKAALSALWVNDLVVTGPVTTGPDGGLPATRGERTLTVGPTRTPDGTTTFTTFASAMASLGRVLAAGTTNVSVDAGVYDEGLVIEGFGGQGTLTVRLAGGDGGERTIFVGPSVIGQNAATVQVVAAATQTNCTWKPVLRNPNGTALMIRNNAGAVVLSGILLRGGAAANTVEARLSSLVSLASCTVDNTPASMSAVYTYLVNLYLYNARGTNAGIGLRVGDGAHVIRRGTALNGATPVSNTGGALSDNGAVTPTDTTPGVTVGQTPETQTFAPSAAMTWRADAARYRLEADGLFQGTVEDTAQTGCLFFAGAAALSGRTVVSARLYLARLAGVGDAQPVAVRLWALACPVSAPSAEAFGPAPLLADGPADGLTLGSLPWRGAGWFDLPANLARQVVAGQGLALRGDAAHFDGGRGTNPPRLAITVV